MENQPSGRKQAIELAHQWKRDRCPIVDGIIFGDGRVKLISADWRPEQDGRSRIVIEQGTWTSLGELRRKEELQWTECIPLCEMIGLAENVRITGGKGGLGSDGFVASVRNDDETILWIAFFSTSNPFEEVQLHTGHVLGKTTLGTWWRFPLNSPEHVTLR